jgi:uncharacterized membrane protein (DUF2068 family)
MSKFPRPPVGIVLIALFKLTKGGLLVALAIGALNLLDKDVGELFSFWITRLHIDLENRFVQSMLASINLVDNRMLEEISAVTFGFAGLLFVEGVGLFLAQRWAEYMTVFETGLFIPLEIFELARHATGTKVVILTVNCAVVAYLLWALVRKPPAKDKSLR